MHEQDLELVEETKKQLHAIDEKRAAGQIHSAEMYSDDNHMPALHVTVTQVPRVTVRRIKQRRTAGDGQFAVRCPAPRVRVTHVRPEPAEPARATISRKTWNQALK